MSSLDSILDRVLGPAKGSRALPQGTHRWKNAELIRFLTPLRTALEEVFTCDTVFGECRLELPAAGHCLIASMVVQDLLGGEILEGEVDEVPHYWNRLGERELDLTGDQFGCSEVLVKRGKLRSKSRVFPRLRWEQLDQGMNAEVCRKHVLFVERVVPVLRSQGKQSLAVALEQRNYKK